MSNTNLFPALPLEEWESTKKTLHLYLQIVGKVQLELAARENHWWHITFRLNHRGLTTNLIHYKNISFSIDNDFIQHQVIINTIEGKTKNIILEDHTSVPTFQKQLFDSLNDLGIYVKILARPFDFETTKPFAKCEEYCTYQRGYVNRFWKILLQIDSVFQEFRGRFVGKVSPAQLFWHSFDYAITRFSGDEGPKMEEGRSSDKDAYSHEVISAGFWAGDNTVRNPAFYSYTYPAPEGLDKEAILPKEAQWIESNGSPMALLMYDDMRQTENPRQTLLDFLESTYQAGAKLAKWDIEKMKYIPV